MRGIKYIGSRNTHTDNLHGTGLVWTPDQVHNVEDGAAAKMLVHTDVYEEAKTVKGEKAAEAAKPKKTEEEQIPLPNLDTMDKDALNIYALQNFGEQLDGRMSEASMRQRLQSMVNSRQLG